MSDPVSDRLGYHPLWLDKLSPDVCLEGSVLNYPVRGADVPTILAFARSLYAFQRFSFLGDIGQGTWIETYTSQVHGREITNTAIVHRNAAGETDSIAMTHRPLSALHLFSSLLRDEFGDAFGADLFLASAPGPQSSPAAGREGGRDPDRV